jgi:hypothetical protein
MGTGQPQLIPVDLAAAAAELADVFNDLSNVLDEFRIANLAPDTPRDKEIKAHAQALEDQSHRFTAESIGAALQSIQADLANIKTVTRQAKDQLKSLNDFSKAVCIATAAVGLGAAIAAGKPDSILSAADALRQAL